ncbi:ParB/RepB/Spo0J family partition protein [Streptomyces erythrochromogenes]|uniref:ParB/RepB/Spo0J family partition protein n=1 Tax=Streptomyces erythrochromogenes TaxID=285574 RepID=UPI003700A1F9
MAPRPAETADRLIGLRDRGILDLPVERVPLDEISVGFSPRVDGEDANWVRTLAETETELPPILVHRPTMTVVDGIHRLRAAALQGRTDIRVRFFDGPPSEAQLLAVAANTAHGRPLTPADRAAAASRIFTIHPLWSDRAVAALTGLSARRVSRLRKDTGAADTAVRRIGRDGRVRPVNSCAGRERAGELLRANPGASLRQIAAEAGLAPATVADVRDRLRRGEHPVPGRGPGPEARDPQPESPPAESWTAPAGSAMHPAEAAAPVELAPVQLALRRPAVPAAPSPDRLLRIFDALRRDPSLRLSESGRNVLRLLSACTVMTQDRQQIAATLPAHCKQPMAQLAQGYARLWNQLADELAAGEDPATLSA